MKSQKVISKSDATKKSPALQRESDRRRPELDNSNEGLKSIFNQTSPRTPPEAFASVLTRPDLSHRANTSQRIGIINQLQRTYGNQYVQRVLQAKLKIGRPGDIYEQEADRVAEQVTSMPEPQVQRQTEEEEEEEQVQAKPIAEQITPLVQRQVEEEEEEELQEKETSGQIPEASPDIESRINAMKGGGQPLPESTRAFFEPRFGSDFSLVRIHTDARAADSTRALNAQAYTMGRDIVFGAGRYAPKTTAGKRLLAHELTHVLQQRGGGRRYASPPVIQRRFINRGRTGIGRVHWAGGTGGPGNEVTGSIQTLVNPGFLGRNPRRAGSVARAWIRPRTGRILVVRSYIGVRGGNQGGGAGNRWFMTRRAARRINRHSNMHSRTTRNLYRRYISPLLRLIGRYRGRANAHRYGSTRAEAIARLRTILGWNSSINDFRDQDRAFNNPGGTVDAHDLASGTYPVDCGAGNVGAVHYDHRVRVPGEACPT